MLPTKVYHYKKTGQNTSSDVMCRLCGKFPETKERVSAGFSASAQMKYLARQNAALKILVFELLRDRNLVDIVRP